MYNTLKGTVLLLLQGTNLQSIHPIVVPSVLHIMSWPLTQVKSSPSKWGCIFNWRPLRLKYLAQILMKSSKTDKKKQIYSMTRFDIISDYFDVRFFLIAMSLKYDKFIGTFKIIKNKFQKIPMRDQKQRQVSRQAYAGLLWSKQFYYYVIEEWLKGTATSRHPQRPGSRDATLSGCTSSTWTSSRCRTSGNIHG